jgi:hypothetical protein
MKLSTSALALFGAAYGLLDHNDDGSVSWVGKDGNTYTIDDQSGCGVIYPYTDDKNTHIPKNYGECPPLEYCYHNIIQHKHDKTNVVCDVGTGPECCSKKYKKSTSCVGRCVDDHASNLDGKGKVAWRCKCTNKFGCHWAPGGKSFNDLTCQYCPTLEHIDWETSGRKQNDMNRETASFGPDGRILSAGWIFGDDYVRTKWYNILILIQGARVKPENIMVWDWKVHEVYTEDFQVGHANYEGGHIDGGQEYTVPSTLIVLRQHTDTSIDYSKEQADILIGIENALDFSNTNIDTSYVTYTVGYLRKWKNAGTAWDFGCVLHHYGADPGKSDQSLSKEFGLRRSFLAKQNL